MRFAQAYAALLLLVFAVLPASAGEGDFKSEELNFEIKLPEESVDWDVITLDPKVHHPTLRVLFESVYADSDAYASVQVMVQKMPSGTAREKLEKTAKRWKGSMESNLANPRERKDKIEKFAGVDAYIAEVEGDRGMGICKVNWLVCKNGQYIYTIVTTRALAAVKDEDLAEEIDLILKSFKFGEIRKAKGGKGAKKDGSKPPDAGGGGDNGGGGASDMEVDPELLKPKKINSAFWRFKAVKPQGLIDEKMTENLRANKIKFAWRGQKNTISMGVRIYAWSLKNKSYTLDQLVARKLKWWEKRVKQTKPPSLDKKYNKKFPMAKKAYRLELIGRSTRRERWLFLMAECTNGRQYMLEIYTMGDVGDAVWGKTVDKFIKDFKPQKK